MRSINGNIDAEGPPADPKKKIVKLSNITEPDTEDLVRAFSWNVGGWQTVDNLAFASWLMSLPNDTDIIALEETKILLGSNKLKNIQEQVEQRFDADFSCYANLFSYEELLALQTLEAHNNKDNGNNAEAEQPPQHTGPKAKGGQVVLIRKHKERRGGPLEHAAPKRHNSKRRMIFEFQRGFRWIQMYGQAASGPSRAHLRGTYAMAKHDFIIDVLSPTLKDHAIIAGDLNLATGRSRKKALDKADEFVRQRLEEKNMINCLDEGWSHDEGTPPYTYKSGRSRSSPDAFLVHDGVMDRNAILELSVDHTRYSATQSHCPIGLVFSVSALAKGKPTLENASFDSGAPRAQDFEESFQGSVDELADTLLELEEFEGDTDRFIEHTVKQLREIPLKHAKASQAKATRSKLHTGEAPRRAHINHDEVLKLRKTRIAIGKPYWVVKQSLKKWIQSDKYCGDAPMRTQQERQWAKRGRKATAELQSLKIQGVNPNDLETPAMPKKDPPSKEEINYMIHWASVVGPQVSKLEKQEKVLLEDLNNQTREALLQRWEHSTNQSHGMLIKALKNKAAALKGRKQRGEFQRIREYSAESQTMEATTEATVRQTLNAAKYWRELAEEKPRPDDWNEPQPWDTAFSAKAERARGKDELDGPISIDEIARHTKSAAKAMPRSDPTPNAFFHRLFLSEGAEEEVNEKKEKIRNIICALVNALFEGDGRVPKHWRIAEYVCLHKSGDKEDPANYRPIALLAALYKIYTAILTERLARYVESNHFLSDSQRGGREQMSTYQLVHQMIATITHAKHEEHLNGEAAEILAILFVDLKKAYNSVPIWAIEQRLESLGVPWKFREAVLALYKDVGGRIRLKNILSEEFEESRGVRQGDPLSPLLWIIFLDPMLHWIRQEKVGVEATVEHSTQANVTVKASVTDASFVDDMAFCVTSNEKARKVCDMTSQFFDFYGLEAGIKQDGSKTALLNVVGDLDPLKLQGQDIPVLEENESYRYLGVPLNANLDTAESFNQTFQRMQEATRIFAVGGRFTPERVRWLANCVIWPIAQYQTRFFQFTTAQCDKLTKLIRAGVRKALRQFDLPNSVIHGAPSHVVGGLGIIDLASQQRADFLGCIHNTVWSTDNPASQWLRFLIHYEASDANGGNGWRLLAPENGKRGPRVRRLKDHFPQLHSLYVAQRETKTKMFLLFDSHTDESAKTRQIIQARRDLPNTMPEMLIQEQGEVARGFLKLNPLKRLSRLACQWTGLPTRPNHTAPETFWCADEDWSEIEVFTFVDGQKIGMSAGITNEHNVVAKQYGKAFNDTDPAHAALQAVELALLACPTKAKTRNTGAILTIQVITIWTAKEEFTALLGMSAKTRRHHPLYDLIWRIQTMMSAFKEAGIVVQFETIPKELLKPNDLNLLRIQDNCEPAWPTIHKAFWLTFVREAKEVNTSKLIVARPTKSVLLLESEHAKMLNATKSGADSMSRIATLVTASLVGKPNDELKKLLRANSKRAAKHNSDLNERAKELELPKKASLTGGLQGSELHDPPLAKFTAATTLKLRLGRADANAYLAARTPQSNPLGLEEVDESVLAPQNLDNILQTNPLPPFTNDSLREAAADQEYAKGKKERTAEDRASIQKAFQKQLEATEKDATLSTKARLEAALKLRKKQAKWLKIQRRYRHLINDKCHRCGGHVKEDVKHLFRDCPLSVEALHELRDTINKTIQATKEGEGLSWNDLWFSDARPEDLPPDNTLIYWTLMGYSPPLLKSVAKRAKCSNLAHALAQATALARRAILKEKSIADALALHHARSIAASCPLVLVTGTEGEPVEEQNQNAPQSATKNGKNALGQEDNAAEGEAPLPNGVSPE